VLKPVQVYELAAWSDNGDPLYGIILMPLAVIHGLVTVGTPGRTERFQMMMSFICSCRNKK
jgi:hypothetical protein